MKTYSLGERILVFAKERSQKCARQCQRLAPSHKVVEPIAVAIAAVTVVVSTAVAALDVVIGPIGERRPSRRRVQYSHHGNGNLQISLNVGGRHGNN